MALYCKGCNLCRQLCVLLNAEDIYKALSSILVQEPNLKFAATLVGVLSTILLTAAELHHLRQQLRGFSAPVRGRGRGAVLQRGGKDPRCQ